MIIIFKKEVNSFSNICTNCNSTSLVNHGSYTRNVISYSDKKVIETICSIKRVKCKSCGKTHAIIPLDIIPYKQYDLQFIKAVLMDYIKKLGASKITLKYQISHQLLYLWVSLFIEHSKRSKCVCSFNSHVILIESITNDFIYRYYQYHKRMFMQFILSRIL